VSNQSKLILSTLLSFLMIVAALYFYFHQNYWGMIIVIPIGLAAALLRTLYRQNKQTFGDQNKITIETLAKLEESKNRKE